MGTRRGAARNSRRIWTAAMEDALGNRWKDFDVVGGRDEATFLRLLERLPGTERYEPDAYGVYGCLPVNKHRVGKVDVVDRNGGLGCIYIARQIEQAGSSYKEMRKKRGDAGESACASLLRQTQTQYHSPLRIPEPMPRLSNRRLVGYTRDICA